MGTQQHPAGELSLRSYGASHGSHTHDHFQILLGLDGVLELEIEGRGRRLGTGQGCVIVAGERHDFEARLGSRCLVLDTRQTGWADCANEPARPAQALLLANYLGTALGEPGSLVRELGPALLLDAWRAAPDPTIQAVQAGARPLRAIAWDSLALWAGARLHQALTVADLAAQVFLSPAQFALRCRRETGLSVMQWLRRQRLARAAELRSSGLGVAETALRCGYQSPSALTAALRRERRQA